MKSRNLKIVAAVAAALTGSAANALSPSVVEGIIDDYVTDLANGGTINTPDGLDQVVLVAAGASAVRNAFGLYFSDIQADGVTANADSLCQTGTFDTYRTTSSAGDFRVYSCTFKTGITGATQLGNLPMVTFYRSEGGSAWGPVSLIANNMCASATTTPCSNTTAGINTIKRMNVTVAGCPTAPSATTGIFNSSSSVTHQAYTCALSGYNVLNDNGTGAIAEATTEFAVSDVEPNQLAIAENYPSSGKFKVFSNAQRTALGTLNGQSLQGFNQVFGIVINSGLTTITNIDAPQLAGIFSGSLTNWNQVPATASTYGPNVPIVVCRREQGSGTQAIANAQYLGIGCSKAPGVFVTDTAPGTGDGVVENSTSGAVNTCLAGSAGSIGISVFGSNPPSAKFVSLNGVAPSRLNSAIGTYRYWNELVFNRRSTLGTSNSLGNVLANLLINRGQLAATFPNNSSTFAIPFPNFSGNNVPTLPVSATDPISLSTTTKTTCADKTAL